MQAEEDPIARLRPLRDLRRGRAGFGN
jgi:hypothetical protein